MSQSRQLSPMEILVDQACGYTPAKQKRLTAEQEIAVNQVAGSVIYHIDTMYPKMWEGVAKSARRSVRNTVYEEVKSLLLKSI